MKWTKLALTTMTLATFGMCFMACDPPPSPEPEYDGEYESEDVMRALHTGFLELDGNAVTTATDDWDEVFNRTDSALASTFVSEAQEEFLTFTGGGSKDINDISSWRHTTGSTPDKNNILDAYAATYTDAEGHKVLYFGADRFSVEGDAQLGFWFFQDPVAAPPGGSFTGLHKNDDILVLVNFTKGGTTPMVQVLKWDDSVENNLVVVEPGTPARCGDAGAQEACAITNDTGPTTSPWDYTPKSGPAGMFPEEAFFEGGIDLTALVSDSDLCFASFMAETRSSTSETAVLKDFVLGAFEECEAVVELTPTCTGVTIESDNTCVNFEIAFTGEVCNHSTGLDSELRNIVVTGPAGALPITDDADDGPNVIASGDCENFTGTYETATVNSSDPGAVTFDASFNLKAVGPGGVPIDITENFVEPCPLCPE